VTESDVNIYSVVCDISLKSIKHKVNDVCLKQGVSLILGHGVVSLFGRLCNAWLFVCLFLLKLLKKLRTNFDIYLDRKGVA